MDYKRYFEILSAGLSGGKVGIRDVDSLQEWIQSVYLITRNGLAGIAMDALEPYDPDSNPEDDSACERDCDSACERGQELAQDQRGQQDHQVQQDRRDQQEQRDQQSQQEQQDRRDRRGQQEQQNQQEREELANNLTDLKLDAEAVEGENRLRLRALRRFGELCATLDTRVLVLKGASMMACYPAPLHRPVSVDIDVMLLPAKSAACSDGSQPQRAMACSDGSKPKRAAACSDGSQPQRAMACSDWSQPEKATPERLEAAPGRVEEELRRRGVVITLTTPKHAAFEWEGAHFESHRHLMNVDDDPAFARTEAMIGDFVEHEGLRELSVAGTTFPNVYVLPPKAGTLYALRHLASHFSAIKGLLARNYIDWGMYLRHYCGEIFDEPTPGTTLQGTPDTPGTTPNTPGIPPDQTPEATPGRKLPSLSAAIFICGLDKALAIFGHITELFVPGSSEISRRLMHIPSRYDSYPRAQRRLHSALLRDYPMVVHREGSGLVGFVRNFRYYALQILNRAWKYKYLPESFSGVIKRTLSRRFR